MALIRPQLPSGKEIGERENAVANYEELLSALHSQNPDVRCEAVHGLGAFPSATEDLASLLEREKDQMVFIAALHGLKAIGTREAVSELVNFLRSEDAFKRNAVIEVLQGMPDQVGPVMEQLFADPRSDIRIFAADILRLLPHPQAEFWLCQSISIEMHPNVIGAIVDRLSEVGTSEAVPYLHKTKEAFSDEPYIAFAIDVALKMCEAS